MSDLPMTDPFLRMGKKQEGMFTFLKILLA